MKKKLLDDNLPIEEKIDLEKLDQDLLSRENVEPMSLPPIDYQSHIEHEYNISDNNLLPDILQYFRFGSKDSIMSMRQKEEDLLQRISKLTPQQEDLILDQLYREYEKLNSVDRSRLLRNDLDWRDHLNRNYGNPSPRIPHSDEPNDLQRVPEEYTDVAVTSPYKSLTKKTIDTGSAPFARTRGFSGDNDLPESARYINNLNEEQEQNSPVNVGLGSMQVPNISAAEQLNIPLIPSYQLGNDLALPPAQYASNIPQGGNIFSKPPLTPEEQAEKNQRKKDDELQRAKNISLTPLMIRPKGRAQGGSVMHGFGSMSKYFGIM